MKFGAPVISVRQTRRGILQIRHFQRISRYDRQSLHCRHYVTVKHNLGHKGWFMRSFLYFIFFSPSLLFYSILFSSLSLSLSLSLFFSLSVRYPFVFVFARSLPDTFVNPVHESRGQLISVTRYNSAPPPFPLPRPSPPKKTIGISRE